MADKNDKSNYKPDITNYDFVWGSDQDQYIKEEQKVETSPSQVKEPLEE